MSIRDLANCYVSARWLESLAFLHWNTGRATMASIFPANIEAVHLNWMAIKMPPKVVQFKRVSEIKSEREQHTYCLGIALLGNTLTNCFNHQEHLVEPKLTFVCQILQQCSWVHPDLGSFNISLADGSMRCVWLQCSTSQLFILSQMVSAKKPRELMHKNYWEEKIYGGIICSHLSRSQKYK